ncbi:uncharacterized protein gramd4a isoform X7 [Melanotaenia boesemani]|uniref:uncharacterized protein gramd4a isoform X7 n=1 Tax=Melanotaenia boesemani TaxID=1250792 RepID=UPI001C03E56F|nr:uncharacterized protein gramd4a isoform X7 [Melanotaenia boesemani]
MKLCYDLRAGVAVRHVKVKPRCAVLTMLKRLDKIRFRGPRTRDDFPDLGESPPASDNECSDDMQLKPRTALRDMEDVLRDPELQPDKTQTDCPSRPPVDQQLEGNPMSEEEEPRFNIHEALRSSCDGSSILASLEQHSISLKQRRQLVRILVSHLVERFGENPSADCKTALAAALVAEFPCLKDTQGKGYEAWYIRGRRNRPATGFLEERLRNIRKKMRQERFSVQTASTANIEQHISSTLVIPDPTISTERALQLAEWLKNNMWPAKQVTDYMRETAIHRAHWIRSNGTKSIDEINNEFPRLLDTPSMISQDFSMLFPQHADKLFETWTISFREKILQLARQEKGAQDLLSTDNLPPEARGDVALRVLPLILPTPVYKDGKKMVKPSLDENMKSFIDYKHVGTNIVEYLGVAESTKPFPFILALGDNNQCSQAFVVIGKQALQHSTLLAAVDTCFKLFYIFDINFPKQCAAVWEFLQIVVYKLPGTESSSIRLLRGYLS